jgi:hypothetical protein
MTGLANFERRTMQRQFVVHPDGRRLALPMWDGDGEIVNTKMPQVAISIVAFDPTAKTTGQTFPPDSIWITDETGWTIEGTGEPWSRPSNSVVSSLLGRKYKAESNERGRELKARKKRAPNASYRAKMVLVPYPSSESLITQPA